MGDQSPKEGSISKKQLERILNKIESLGVKDIRSFLETLYKEAGSLRKMRDVLKSRGIKLRPKDLLIIMDYYGINRNRKSIQPNTKFREYKKFKGNNRDKLYLWGFCKGDARIECNLTTIRIDVNGKIETVKCLANALKQYIADQKQAFKANKYGYYTFSHSFHKQTFIFLLSNIDEISKTISNIEDLAALLAGLIDSDGTIYMKNRKRKRNGKTYTNFEAYIGLINKDLNLLKTLQKLLSKHGIKANIPNSTTQFGAYRLRITKKKHLRALIPLLEKYMKHETKPSKIKQLKNKLK